MTPSEMGRKGGKNRVKKLTKAQRSEQMKALAEARWAKSARRAAGKQGAGNTRNDQPAISVSRGGE